MCFDLPSGICFIRIIWCSVSCPPGLLIGWTVTPTPQYQARVDAINRLEPAIKALSDEQLRAKTAEFKTRLAQGKTLDDVLPEAFAVAREAAWRAGPNKAFLLYDTMAGHFCTVTFLFPLFLEPLQTFQRTQYTNGA